MPPEQAASPLAQFPIVPYLVIFLIFYFLVIKPQKKKQKEQKEMLGALKKNDRVVTSGGMHGTISLVKENTVVVRVDDNVKIEFDRSAISAVEKTKS